MVNSSLCKLSFLTKPREKGNALGFIMNLLAATQELSDHHSRGFNLSRKCINRVILSQSQHEDTLDFGSTKARGCCLLILGLASDATSPLLVESMKIAARSSALMPIVVAALAVVAGPTLACDTPDGGNCLPGEDEEAICCPTGFYCQPYTPMKMEATCQPTPNNCRGIRLDYVLTLPEKPLNTLNGFTVEQCCQYCTDWGNCAAWIYYRDAGVPDSITHCTLIDEAAYKNAARVWQPGSLYGLGPSTPKEADRLRVRVHVHAHSHKHSP